MHQPVFLRAIDRAQSEMQGLGAQVQEGMLAQPPLEKVHFDLVWFSFQLLKKKS